MDILTSKDNVTLTSWILLQNLASNIVKIICFLGVFTDLALQTSIQDLFLILFIFCLIQLSIHLAYYFRNRRLKFSSRRQFLSGILEHICYAFLALSLYLFLKGKLDVKYLLAFDLVAIFFAFASIFALSLPFAYHLASPVMTYSLLATVFYLKITQGDISFLWAWLWIIVFVLYAGYLLLCVIKLYFSASLYNNLKKSGHFNTESHGGVLMSLLVSLNRFWNLCF